jgi:hypothetical protein
MLIFIDETKPFWEGLENDAAEDEEGSYPWLKPDVESWMKAKGIPVEWFSKGLNFWWALKFGNDEDAMLFKLTYPIGTYFENDPRHKADWDR